ncbi:TfoX/Sxy family protein [Nocardioides dongxiaopingii]|uniref:TfoX/Sxy family protein n=1 Tax=Nocardioides sp. S-1144 TaxID=2582905 RepID=UPI00110D95C3|nr:TfoX/Sxy family protein [Nocardioides sp. S-1144]QCW49475.1 TfoX/Sxy family protein [Nocardioides sp. S-1144]
MAHDETLATRVRELIEQPAVERRMFGGLAFLLDGNLAVCVSGRGGLLLRVDDDAERARLLTRDQVGPMVMGSRTSTTWLEVGPGALRTRRQLAAWVARGVAAARSRPPK